MGDYYTEFSFVVEAITQEEAEWLAKQYSPLKDKFFMQITDGPEDVAWFHDNGGQPDLQALIQFLQQFLKKFRRDDHIFFEWANTCSKPRVDGYGGGACLVTSTCSSTRPTADLQSLLEDDVVNHPANA